MAHERAEIPRVFVYGTLRPGFENPGRELLAAQADHEAHARVRGKLAVIQGLPALLVDQASDETAWVLGDVYQLDAPAPLLEALDRYEGVEGPHPGPYDRQVHEVVLDDGSRCRAWVYVWTGPTHGARPVPEGDYIEFLARQGDDEA